MTVGPDRGKDITYKDVFPMGTPDGFSGRQAHWNEALEGCLKVHRTVVTRSHDLKWGLEFLRRPADSVLAFLHK